MSIEEFKEYLDMVVEKAFKMGVIWERNGKDLENMQDSIKNTQEKNLKMLMLFQKRLIGIGKQRMDRRNT